MTKYFVIYCDNSWGLFHKARRSVLTSENNVQNDKIDHNLLYRMTSDEQLANLNKMIGKFEQMTSVGFTKRFPVIFTCGFIAPLG